MLSVTPDQDAAPANRARLNFIVVAVVLVGLLARASIVLWDRPWEPHHPDEHILPLEAIALWEGITPREVGWPATTTRLAMSAASAVAWVAERGQAAWTMRDRPQAALAILTEWIGRQYVDPSESYRIGRVLSVLTGVLQLVALAWVLRSWVGPPGVMVTVLAVALAPIVVLHSQYVLADITGLLFATLIMQRQETPTYRRVFLTAIFAALAAASKLHFGLWLLTPVLSVVLSRGSALRTRIGLLAAAAGGFVWMFVALFPWSWTNPLLAIKEFVGVVAIKVGTTPASGTQLLANLWLLFGSTGMLLWLGVLLGLCCLKRSEWRHVLAIALPMVIGALILGRSAIVFDRYAMVLAPGMAVLAAIGWHRALTASGRALVIARTAAGFALIVTLTQLVAAERVAGEADVDSLARAWVLENVPRGARVAVHDESNASLPRSAAQLSACSRAAEGMDAYRRKWEQLGYPPPDGGAEPLRLMLLNDEMSYAYWCRRELEAQHDPGYFVIRYHADRRANAVLERDVIAELANGDAVGGNAVGGIDVLVINRQLGDRDSRAVLRTRRGARFIYTR